VRAIVELAGSVAIETVAEGVDQERGLLLLRELGVDFARGAACGAPAPLEEMLPTLGADESRRLQRLFLEL
jgi:EAL domain-containing protein (putative c-di-GMP-specific phosphodiesterase class I)